jgi:hypothetical protein
MVPSLGTVEGGVVMKRRFVGVSLFLVSGLLTGCEMLHHGLRGKSEEPPLESYEGSDKKDEESVVPEGVHRSKRLRGALSDEGAEIERHLGI